MKRVCVYCGSNPGRNPEYVAAATALGSVLVSKGIGLVYGGASIGVMGAVADAVSAQGGEVIGIIPQDLLKKESAHHGITELKVVGSMHERKGLMAKYSDGFVALPGGLGTLEELLEVWTWAQLGFHQKPCSVLNVHSYYDSLIRFIDEAVAEGFVKAEHRAMLIVERDPEELIHALENYQPPEVPKWLDQKGL